MDRNAKRLSRYFSYLLRHRPDAIGLRLDANGWASIDELIRKTSSLRLTRELVEIVVQTNDKQRFRISDDGTRIKANHGHSIQIKMDLPPSKPPVFLLHGTAERFMKSIRSKGLLKMKRHHVHLTESLSVARSVGTRHGTLVVLKVDALKLFEAGGLFFKTPNNVWLVEHVPAEFVEIA